MELEAKLAELQQELTVLQMQDKRTLIAWDDPYGFLGSDSEPTSGQLSQKRKKGQVFPPAISYGGFFLSKASTSVLADEPMLSGDDLFSTPKTSQSLSYSDLGHLQRSSDSDHLRVPETLQRTSYSEPLPAVPNATVRSFHPDPSPNIPSDGCSETSTSSDPKSGLTFFRNSPSCSGDGAAPMASNIKCQGLMVVRIDGECWAMALIVD